jgi:hypothetical protein
MQIQSSNKQEYYLVTLDSCNCLDFVKRNKSQNRLSCKCEKTFECKLCSCKHQRENLADIMNEDIKQ